MENTSESFKISSETCESLKNKIKIEEIIDYLYFNSNSIENYSTYELELIIKYSNFNKKLCLQLIDNSIKEILLNDIEDWKVNEEQLEKENKSRVRLRELETTYMKKEYYKIEVLPESLIEKFSYKKPWDFLKNDVLLIDIRDELRIIDQYKLINDALKIVKDKDNHKLNLFFEKHDEERRILIKKLFSKRIEVNDIKFLRDNDNFLGINIYNSNKLEIKDKDKEEIEEYPKGDVFEKYFIKKINKLLKNLILEYIGFEYILNLSLSNKTMYNCIKNFSKEHLSKIYCSAIFKYSNLYNNDISNIKTNYSNLYDMLINRKRIKYGGIYYSQVKYIKTVENSVKVQGETQFTVFNFRFVRFFPCGKAFILTSYERNSRSLLKKINNNECDMKEGRFYIENEYVFIIVKYNILYDLHYKMLMNNVYYDDIKYDGLELKNCYLVDEKGEKSDFKFNEYMPKLFRYRRLKILDEGLYIKTEYK